MDDAIKLRLAVRYGVGKIYALNFKRETIQRSLVVERSAVKRFSSGFKVRERAEEKRFYLA